MFRRITIAAVLAVAATAVVAQSNVITQRKDIMKSVGAATRTGTLMVRGEAPFDAAKAKEVFDTYIDAAAKMPASSPPIRRPAARPRRRPRSGRTRRTSMRSSRPGART